jgi:hypothetical protein
MNVLRTAGTTVAVLALAFGAAAPVYAASAPAVVSHVAVAPADGPSGGDRGWGHDGWGHDGWGHDGWRHHHHGHRGWGHPHGGVWAGGGAMANSVARLTSHIGG